MEEIQDEYNQEIDAFRIEYKEENDKNLTGIIDKIDQMDIDGKYIFNENNFHKIIILLRHT